MRKTMWWAVAGLLALTLAPGPTRAQEAPRPASTAGERRGWFGISLSCDDCVILRAGRIAYTRAPHIVTVESGSPAHLAGLRNGDTIVAVEGLALTTPEGFERFATARIGVPIRLTVRSYGQERDVTVNPIERSSASTIAEYYNSRLRTAQRAGITALRSGFRTPLGWLGFQAEFIEAGGVRRTPRFREPPVVLMVDVDGPAHRAGLRRGDTLTAMDGLDLTTTEGQRAFGRVEPGQRVTLTVRRGGPERRVPLVAVPRPDATRAELAAFEEYRTARDSVESEYRQIATVGLARARAEMAEFERLLRETELSRREAIDSSRRRLMAIDSVLRALRNERNRIGEAGGFDVIWGPPAAMALMAQPPQPPQPAQPARAPLLPGMPTPTVAYPLRYSNRLGDLVNVEVRAPGFVAAQEVGDSVIVLTIPGGVLVKVERRPGTRR